MTLSSTRGLRIPATALLAVLLVAAFAPQAGAAGNFVKQVMDHESAVTWITYKTPTIPPDVCNLLDVCAGAAAKVAALPPATIGGHKVGRALFLTQTTKKQPAVLLEHQVPGREVYFFLLGPDGSVQKTAYLEEGKSFIVIANSLGQSVLNGDMKDWDAWAAKLGSGKSSEKGADKGN
ncbi:MAG TPA: hypothetical protein VG322_00500 [Candidatus Acidoferrales bacterium]|nr:hypothetical protein [Candidatus Acidoferrales bacterium]